MLDANTTTYLTTAEAASLLRVKPQTLRKRRLTGDGPPFRRAFSRILYRKDELLAWVESTKRASTSDDRE